MSVDIQSVVIPNMDCISSDKVNPIDIKMEQRNNNNIIYTHLSDHDYLETSFTTHTTSSSPNTTKTPVLQKPRPKKPKRQVKITELKAIYNCTTCGYRTMNREVLKQHICVKNVDFSLSKNSSVKLPAGYVRCPKCNFCTKNMSNMTVHLGTHIEGVRQICTDCNIPKNCKDKVFKCPKCYYSTKNPTSLKVHLHIHSRGTPYKCTECNYSAKDLKELIKHYDGMKDLRCKCGYTTHVRQHMITHKRSHIVEKPFNCEICQFVARDTAGLQRHMKKHSTA